jgi:hypothetical protein
MGVCKDSSNPANNPTKISRTNLLIRKTTQASIASKREASIQQLRGRTEMRLLYLMFLVFAIGVAGCNQPTETVPGVDGGGTSGVTDDGAEVESSVEAPPAADGADASQDTGVRFVADKKLEVPGMMCPYGCYPAIEEALAALPGIQAIQLAEQPAGTPEGVIVKRVVELKLSEGFDLDQALATLKTANFEAKEIN